MGRAYEAPPITEAICEFRFDSKEDWDFAIPGLLYEKLKKTFPRRDQMIPVATVLTAAGIGLVDPYVIPLVKFLEDDGNFLVQIGYNLLTVNHAAPYTTWELFQSRVNESLHAYYEVGNLERFRHVALRYINRVVFQEKIKLEDYFNFHPFLEQGLPQDIQAFLVGVELPSEDPAGIINLQLGSSDPEDAGSTVVLLHINYILSQPEEIEFGQVPDLLSRAHEKLEEVFEACITDKLRQKFGEAK